MTTKFSHMSDENFLDFARNMVKSDFEIELLERLLYMTEYSNDQCDEYEKLVVSNENGVKELEDKIKELETENVKLMDEISELENENSALEEENTILENRINTLEFENEELIVKFGILEFEFNMLKTKEEYRKHFLD